MKVLITGENGYISKFLLNKLNQKSKLHALKISVRNNLVNQLELHDIDTIVHAAAIVHKKESAQSEKIYQRVNTDLTVDLAKSAKKQGVKHFIFISTMAVYGVEIGEVSEKTTLAPATLYGKSKLLAEQQLVALEDDNFIVTIVRPPMVYGPGCPGNYRLLSRISKNILIFPNVSNQRSMIFIGNLLEFLYQLIINRDSGVYHPQDGQYINTSYMVRTIAEIHNKKLILNKFSGSLLRTFIGQKLIFKKVFGSLYYNQSLTTYRDNSYQKYNFYQAIEITENMKTYKFVSNEIE